MILGVCNGFQALIKTGLLPYGEIKTLDSDAPTLTHNAIGRHMAQFIKTKVVATNSPWTSLLTEGDIHQIPVSHGEGRLIGSEAVIKQLYDNHQVAFQYVDDSGNPTMKLPYNPNGSYGAIEGLVSPCGRILGKMGHTGIATGVHLHLTMYKGHLDSENSEMIDPKSVIDLPSNWNSRVY